MQMPRHTTLTYIRLGAAQLELADGNLCLFHTSRASRSTNDILLQHQSLNELSIVNCASDLLDQANVAQVHVDLFLG